MSFGKMSRALLNDAAYVAKSTGTNEPIELNAECVSYASRPRLWWLTWNINATGKERWNQGKHWPRLINWGERRPTPPWRDTGYSAKKPTLT